MNSVRKAVGNLDYDSEYTEYPDNLWVDMPNGTLIEVFDGELIFEDDLNNQVKIPEWAFEKFVEIWQAERRGSIPAELWEIQFKQWDAQEGTPMTDGWKSVGCGPFEGRNEANLEMDKRRARADSFVYTRVVYRVVKVG